MICDCFYPESILNQPAPRIKPQQSVPLCCEERSQSGFDELVNPGLRSVVRAGSMMAKSLKGWSDGFIGQECMGQNVGGLVIGLIYPQSPECHLHQFSSVIAASLLRCLRSRKCVYGVCLCLCLCVCTVYGWTIIILTSVRFPPVTHLNEAPKTEETVCVCSYLIHRCFYGLFFFHLLLFFSPPTWVIYNLISNL